VAENAIFPNRISFRGLGDEDAAFYAIIGCAELLVWN